MGASVVFVLIWLFIILIPCVGIGWIGLKMVNKLGRFPSKTPAIQKDVFLKIFIIEIVSLTLMLIFFKVLSE